MTRLEQAHALLHDIIKIKNRCGSPEIVRKNPKLHTDLCFDVAEWLKDLFREEAKENNDE